MIVRKYSPSTDEALFSSADGLLRTLGSNIKRWSEMGYISLKSCFVSEQDSVISGGIVFGNSEKNELQVLDFFAPRESISDGAALIRESVEKLKKRPFRTVQYNLYNDNDFFEPAKSMFLQAGFNVAQEKKSFEYTGAPLPNRTGRISFKPLADTGDELFTKMVERVTIGTLDSKMARDALELGDEAVARNYVEVLKTLDSDTSLWQLGYSDGKAVGLIIPQKLNESMGGINYIGVVPEKRGKGYGFDLLLEGTRALTDTDITKIIADIDVNNAPMEKALEALGYVFKYEENVLELVVS